jgi:hypothetical protein
MVERKRKRYNEGKQFDYEKANQVPTLKEIGIKKDFMIYNLLKYKTLRRENNQSDPNYERDSLLNEVDD